MHTCISAKDKHGRLYLQIASYFQLPQPKQLIPLSIARQRLLTHMLRGYLRIFSTRSIK